MTVSDVPLGSATPPRGSNAGAYTRVHARVPATLRNHKIGVAGASLARVVAADVRGWWLLVDQPGPLTAWWATAQPKTVPADNTALRVAAAVDKWTFGLAVAALSTALFLAAGTLRWLAAHPARRWCALLIAAVSIGAAIASTHLAPK